VQLRVGGLADDTSEAELNELFSKIGTVGSVIIVKDISTGKSRGFGMVKMPNSTQADEAIKKLDGTFTIPCARIVGEKGKVYALEVRSEALKRVKEKAEGEGLGNVETILADSSMLATGLSDRSMDVILVYDVMHAISEKMALLEELHRVLKRDGFLSIFPMHMGTDRMLKVMKRCPLFRFRDSYAPPGYTTPSEILNFNKY